MSLVVAHLDYGNASLAGLPNTLLNRLQFVLNAAARLIYSARKHDHISPLLNDLHWLRFLSGLSSSSLCSFTDVYVAQRHLTWLMNCVVFQTCQHDSVSDPHQQQHLTFQ